MAILMGIILIVLGIIMLAAPLAAGAATVMVIGVFMVLAGIVEFFRGFKVKAALSRVMWLLVGLVTFLCGGLVIAHPVLGLGFLTLLLAVYFFIDGCVKIGIAFRHVTGRGWLVFGGVLSFVLAYLIWVNWPLSGAWAVGILMGVNFIFTGITMIAVGEAAS